MAETGVVGGFIPHLAVVLYQGPHKSFGSKRSQLGAGKHIILCALVSSTYLREGRFGLRLMHSLINIVSKIHGRCIDELLCHGYHFFESSKAHLIECYVILLLDMS